MYFTDLRVKIGNFFRKHKAQIYIAVIVIAIIIAVNILIGKMKDSEPPSTSYEPHKPIISGSEVKSKTVQKSIETTIKEYMDFCKNKDYKSAYNALSDECKEYKFNNKIEEFKNYIDAIYDGDKIYSIQDYSNKDNIYIYKVTIMEDIMATGKNNEDSDKVFDEKVVLTKNGDDYKLAVGGFIKAEDIENVAEDDNMKIYLTKKVTFYDKVIYTVKIKNKTEYPIVFERNRENGCIYLSLNGDNRAETLDNYSNTEKVVYGGNTKQYDITFPVYFDETRQPTKFIFDKVRILQDYTGVDKLWEKELNNAIKKYSVTMPLN